MNAIEILLAEVEHTADLAHSDGSDVTAAKLRSHLRKYWELTERERIENDRQPDEPDS